MSEDNTPSTGLILKYPDVLGTRSVIHSFSIILRNYKTKINLEKRRTQKTSLLIHILVKVFSIDLI